MPSSASQSRRSWSASAEPCYDRSSWTPSPSPRSREPAPVSILEASYAALKAAVELGTDVVVPAAVLAEQYRGGHHDQVVDSCLNRATGIEVADTTRTLAQRIGNILARAGRGSRDHVDAAVVAVAVLAGGGVIVTGDPDDLGALAAGLPGVAIEPV